MRCGMRSASQHQLRRVVPCNLPYLEISYASRTLLLIWACDTMRSRQIMIYFFFLPVFFLPPVPFFFFFFGGAIAALCV